MAEPPKPGTRLLLLATSYGREFAQQIAQVGSCVYLLSGGEGEQSHVTAPLIEVADQAVLTYWMRSIKKVPRLLPLQEKVFILCNPSNYPEFVAWAGNGNRSSGGFPISNIIACPNASEDGMLKHLAWFIEQSYDSHLVVAEADYCFEPDFNLQRIVEHSLLRGTDTVATMPIPRTVKGADLSQFAYATVENPAAACPCVLEVLMDPPAEDAGADGGACVRAIAPLYVFRRSTCSDIVSFAHTADCSGSKQVARFLIAQQQQQQQRPLHTLGVDFAFNVRTLQDFLFTDAFFQYFNKEKARFLASGKKRNNDSDIQLWEEPPDQPAVALEARHKHQLSVAAGEASDPSGAFAAYSQQAEEKQRAVFGDTTLHALLATFTKTFHLDVSVGRACDAPSVPDRFADVGSWRLKPQLQHPCYITSNNSYGRQQPQQAEMPLVWHGMQGQFTSSFNGHTYHNCSLVTGVKRSKVHKLLDEFAPHT